MTRRALRFTAHAAWSHRRAIVVIGLGIGLSTIQQATQFKTLFGNSPAERAGAVAGMQSLSRTFVVLIPPPVRLDTAAGFIDWRLFGAAPIYIAIYALIAGAAVLRGEEERGLVEAWLGAGLGRSTLVICRAVAFTLAVGASALLAALIAIGGTQALKLGIDGAALATTMFLLMLPPLFFFALSLLLSQVLPSRRGAAGLVGGVAVLTFVLGNLSFLVDALQPLRWLSPFYFYDEAHALAEGTALRPLYLLPLVAATLLLLLLAALVFRWRDVNTPLLRASQETSSDPYQLIAYPPGLVLSTVYELRWTIASWTAGVVLIAAIDTISLKPVVESFGNSQTLKQFIARLGGGGQTDLALGFLNFGVFVVGGTLIAALVINVVSRFASDQEERRVEMELAQPVTPLDVHLARFAAILVAATAPSLALVATVLIAAGADGIDIGHAHLAAATVMVVVMALAVGSLGTAILPRFNRLAVSLLSALLGVSFVVSIIGSLNGLPDWVLNLSLIKAYGSPAVHGVDRDGLLVLLGLVAAGVVATVLQARTEMTSG